MFFDVEKFKFIRDIVMSEYLDVFGEELGCMEGKVYFEIDLNVVFIVMLLCCVFVVFKEKLKNEFD